MQEFQFLHAYIFIIKLSLFKKKSELCRNLTKLNQCIV